MKKTLTLKISISGVRGVVGDSLTPQLASHFAQAFGTYLNGGKVLVGQDPRISGVMVKNAVFSGLLSVGCQPVDLGICPIPSFLYLTKESEGKGGIVVTASHNPDDWNGLKFISEEGLYLNPSQTEEFLDIYHQGEFSMVKADKYKAILSEEDPTMPHFHKLLAYLDVHPIREKKFKVVADCCRGAGAKLLPKFLKSLGCHVILVNEKIDSARPHHHEPTVSNITHLCHEVRAQKADIGFAQDADADRLAIVDEKGRALGEELTLALAMNHVLAGKPGPVVTNLSTTRALDDLARRYGVPIFRTKIGEIHVVQELLRQKGIIGGEGNGGVIYPEIHPCRDSFAAMGLVLEAMARCGKTVSQLRDEIPLYYMMKDKVQGSFQQAYGILRGLTKKYAGQQKISTLDGLKIEYENAWVHIRPSNTEPIIRVIAEAGSPREAQTMMRQFKKEILGLKTWKSS
ncbi:MAG: phosphoglucosamine mutase [Armatimonadetes bacterium]|nr:phosphoglucosamine mutase [Armatimonadota bacterium]